MLKKVYSDTEIPTGYVDVKIYGAQRFTMHTYAMKGKIPAVHFFSKRTNKKGTVYLDKALADVHVAKLRENAKKSEEKKKERNPFFSTPVEGPNPFIKKIMSLEAITESLTSLHDKHDRLEAKIDRLMEVWDA